MENRNQNNKRPASAGNNRPVPSGNKRPTQTGNNRPVHSNTPGMNESNLRRTGTKQTTVEDSIPMPPPKKKKKMSVGVKVLLGVFISFAVIVLAVVVYFVGVLTLYKPAGNNSELPSYLQGIAGSGENGEGNPVPPAMDDNQYNFLVVARDKVSGLTDVMMIINYNITDQSLSVMQIPRDTYIEIDDYYYHKINGAYTYFLNSRRGETNADRAALRDVADLLENNLCIKIHYTAQMDIDGFSDIVDAIGGVDMYVPQRMEYYDPEQKLYINLFEGYQTLDGEKAEQFVRYRYGYPDGDIGRGNAQKLFMTAFVKKVLSSISITDVKVITDLATTVYDCISTDLTLNDLIFFGKNFIGFGGGERVDLENVNMFTLPGTGFYYELSYYSLNKESTTDAVNKYFNIYDVDISSAFDKNSIFLNEDSADGKNIYTLPKSEFELNIYNGEEVDSGKK